MTCLGIVPARGGSKGVPGKNIKLLGGFPLIAHTLKAAGESERLDHVIVSTDSNAIAEVATEYGYAPPFIRPKALAGDTIPDRPVIQHALEWWRRHHGRTIDSVVYLRPTTPFKTGALIDAAIGALQAEPELTAVRTVSPVTGPEHPYWAYASTDGVLRPFVEGLDETRYLRRQSLPECWRPNGLVDCLRPAVVEENPQIYGNRIGFVPVTDWRGADIDTALDFDWCAFLLERHQAVTAGDSGDRP